MEKEKKKSKLKIIIPVVLVVLVVVIIIGLIIGISTKNNNKQQIYNNAKTAYEGLNEVVEDTSTIMSSVYSAWYFGIFEDYNKKNVYALARRYKPKQQRH